MASATPEKDTTKPFTAALTTFPHPLQPLSSRATIRTPRLLLRPLTNNDLYAFHKLCSQPSFMAESNTGRADSSISETQTALDKHLAMWETHFWFGVFLAAENGKEGEEEGEMIGDCGIHSLRGSCSAWPEIGYKLAEPHRGKGYATEAVAAVLKSWWELPRGTERVSVHPDTVQRVDPVEDGDAGEAPRVKERIAAQIATYNAASRRVLEKLGFKHFGTWDEPDTQLHRLGQPIEIGHYVL